MSFEDIKDDGSHESWKLYRDAASELALVLKKAEDIVSKGIKDEKLKPIAFQLVLSKLIQEEEIE
jgi:hypothetical protein